MKLILVAMLLAAIFVPPKEIVRRTRTPLPSTPLMFEANEGQRDPGVSFVARGAGYDAFVTSGELVLRAAGKHSTGSVRVTFAGADKSARLVGTRPLATTSHYFVGNDPRRWRSRVSNFARVECRDMYRGIDLVYSSKDRELELDWILAPGADPNQIRLEFEDVDGLAVSESGDLSLKREGVSLQLHKPTLYQEDGQGRREVAGGYRQLGARAVSFEIGKYDTTRPLVIDPIISFASYLGGREADFGLAVAVDRLGNAYVAGQSLSTESPANGSLVAYVAKLDPAGTEAEWVAFVGGTEPPVPQNILFDMMALTVDGAGFTYLVGDTTASDFPTVNAVQSRPGGFHDAFIVKLSPAGDKLVYSTYLGGVFDDWGRGLALDAGGNLLVTGITSSFDFPTVHALQPALHGRQDAFVAKLDPSGSTLVYSTFLGGTDGTAPDRAGDLGYGIAADGVGNAYVCGYTSSPDFPTVNPLRASFAGGTHDAFAAKIAEDGSALVYSTYVGGASDEECLGIAVDRSESAYITGWTASANFPVVGSTRRFGGSLDAFVAKLTPDGSSLAYSTYLGGAAADFAYDIAVDYRGQAHIAGATSSPDFPVAAAVQPSYGGGSSDAFVSVLSADGASLSSSTFLGGSGAESLLVTSMGIALSRSTAVLVAGSTNSPDFPLVRPIQAAHGGAVDAFVTRISYGPEVRLTLEPHGSQQSVAIDVTNSATLPRDVELKLWVDSENGRFLLYESGLSLTLAPAEDRILPAVALPAAATRGQFEVRARLMDNATGNVLSATCTGSRGRCSDPGRDPSRDR